MCARAQYSFRSSAMLRDRAIARNEPFAHKTEIDIAVQHPQQVIFGNLLLPGGSSRTVTRSAFVHPAFGMLPLNI